jgi:hypothetical protein
MYIIESLCSEIVDYTDDDYTKEKLRDVLEKCLHKDDSDVAPKGEIPMGSKSKAVKSANKVIHKPDINAWFEVNNKTGKERRITKKKYLTLLHKSKKSKSSFPTGGKTKKSK